MVSVTQARKHLRNLIAKGDEVILTRHGLPVARLMPLPQDKTGPVAYGDLEGLYVDETLFADLGVRD